MSSTVGAKLERVFDVARPVRDILEQRVERATPPTWCTTRAWEGFLLGLDDVALGRSEAHGLSAELGRHADAPADLRELALAIADVSELPRLRGAASLDQESLRNVKLRKRAQLSGLLGAVAGMAERAERIVDVGAGSGHFTRLSAELFDRDALGLERSEARVLAAKQRSGSSRARFVALDVPEAFALGASDLAIGLHACGELGDRLIGAAALAGCDVALVSCCLQKVSSAVRRPLSHAASQASLKREHLGLTNLTAQPRGVESTIEQTISARQTRFALGQLLRARGVELEPGAEMTGINRRQAGHGLRAVAERALAARGLAAPSESELAQHEALAASEYAIIRRLSLPRSMLARLVEVLVTLDRAAHLEESGHSVLVATLFDRAVSPRNIGIFASRSLSRLPLA